MAGLRRALTDVKYLVPSIERRLLPRMLAVAAMGALAAGTYGILHDQITYSISPEYFIRFKFDQFNGADFGFHPRVFVAEIGFLATWWAGLIAGWFLARIALPAWPEALAKQRILAGFYIVIAFAICGGIFGFVSSDYAGDPSGWMEWTSRLGVIDAIAFRQVGFIHAGSYLGGLAGLLSAIAYLLNLKRRDRSRRQLS